MAELAKSVINSDFLSASQSPSREFSLMAWRLFAGSDAEWDRAIAQLHNSSPYQTSSWARFREPEAGHPFEWSPPTTQDWCNSCIDVSGG